MKKLPPPFLVSALVLAAAVSTQVGSVAVLDPERRAKAVYLENNIQLQKLWRLPFGLFVAVPRVEGVVRIDCTGKPARSLTFGYVTPGFHSRFNLKDGCSTGAATTSKHSRRPHLSLYHGQQTLVQ